MFDILDEVKDGFWFKCQECGRCCKGVNDGYVVLFDDEIKKICTKLNITAERFLIDYADIIESEYRVFDNHRRPTKTKVFLKSIVLKQDNKVGICVFLDETTNKCKVYDVRPLQCCTWPHWYMNMTRKDCLASAKAKCPGISLEKDPSKEWISPQQIMKSIENEIEIEQNYIKKMKCTKGNLKRAHPFLKSVKNKTI